jgi:hypothetical protein
LHFSHASKSVTRSRPDGNRTREDVTVRIAEQHESFFVKNMVAILLEERVALTVFRTQALIRGNFVS